jgi:16S rRNA (uracil1498-N3)-methyltransferase
MPRPPRFFISPDQAHGSEITVSGEDLRHIRTVLRKQPGDLLILLDGQGMEYEVKITGMERAEIRTEILRQSKREILHPMITLGQGLAKSDKMDWIVQKATELGVSGIVPLVTERTVVKVKDGGRRVERWQKIAREAAMQSNRPDIPTVLSPVSFGDFIRTQDPSPGTLLLLPWEEGTVPLKDVLRGKGSFQSITVLIGPEGGLSPTEAQTAKDKGFHLVSLGPNILRTETAAVAALSMIAYEHLACQADSGASSRP